MGEVPIEVMLTKAKANKNIELTVAVIQVSRLLNHLTSNLRRMMNSHNSQTGDVGIADFLDSLLNQAGLLCEAAKVFSHHQKEFSTIIQANKEIRELMKKVTKQYGDENSFFNQVLSPMRNKLYFHFDRDIIKGQLEMHEEEELLFLSSESKRCGDSVYQLAYSVLIGHLRSLVKEHNSEEDNPEEYISNEMMELTIT